MEVHPPEHPIHTWRDFFVHIATIVVGLLIAIGLEQSVEWVHHRHLVHTAHHNLRAEAAENERRFGENEVSLAKTKASLLTDLQTLHAMQKDPRSGQGAKLTATWHWESFEDSAYTTSRDTGALTYMPFDEVQAIDGVYRQQGYVFTALGNFWRADYQILIPTGGTRSLASLTPSEVDTEIENVSASLGSLELLSDLMRNMGDDFHQLAHE